MKRCYTLSKAGTRLNINTFYRPHYTRTYREYVPSPVKDEVIHPSMSKATRLPWWTRFVLWVKRKFFGYEC